MVAAAPIAVRVLFVGREIYCLLRGRSQFSMSLFFGIQPERLATFLPDFEVFLGSDD